MLKCTLINTFIVDNVKKQKQKKHPKIPNCFVLYI